MGNGELVDSMISDGLWCAFDAVHMGAGTERYTGEVGGITREAQDELAAKSHERAPTRSRTAGSPRRSRRWRSRSARATRWSSTPTKACARAPPPSRSAASAPRSRRTAPSPPATRRRSPTAGAAVIVTSLAKAEELGLTPIAELVSFGLVAGPDPSLLQQPSRAIKRALEPIDMKVSDIDLFELNEAFAAVGIASMRDLGISDDIVNVNGGAIALGHPIGMSGARVVLTLINELRRRGGGLGAAALCGGGGQGEAAIVRAVARARSETAALSSDTSRTSPTGSSPGCCRLRRARS